MSADAGPASYRSLLASLREHVRAYIARQLLLPRQEIRELLVANAIAAAWIGAGLLFLGLFLVALVVLVVAVIAIWVPLPVAALLAMLLFLAIAALLVLVGYRKLELRGPERSIRSVKETISWVKATLLGQSES